MHEDGQPYWRRNLAVMWVTQFLSLMGFSMSIPFTPFYLRVLGVADEDHIRAYAAASAALANIALAVMSPLWGVLADRYGRKAMVLRANFGGALIVGLMGVAPNVSTFLLLRFLQGMFTGTMSASMTLVVTCTPTRKQGLALGILSSSVFSGDMAGLFIGGLLSSVCGFRQTFLFSGLALGISGLLVLWQAREDFVREARHRLSAPPVGGWRERLAILLPAAPLFVLFVVSTMARSLDYSQYPLFVEMLNGGKEVAGAPRWTSWVLGMGSIGAVLSGFVLGRLVDAYPTRVARFGAVGAAVFMGTMAGIPFLLGGLPRVRLTAGDGLLGNASWAVLSLLPLRFGMAFCAAGLEPVWNAWLSKITPPSRKGLMFGWAVTFRAIGAILAHICAGVIAYSLGIRAIFVVGPLLFLSLVPLVVRFAQRISVRVAAQTAGLGLQADAVSPAP